MKIITKNIKNKLNHIFKFSILSTIVGFSSFSQASNINDILFWKDESGLVIIIDKSHSPPHLLKISCLRSEHQHVSSPIPTLLIEPPEIFYIKPIILVPEPRVSKLINEAPTTQHFYTEFSFHPGQYQLSANHVEKIQLLEDFLLSSQNESTHIQAVNITSFTDSTGSPEFNRQLSLQRALTVKEFLVLNGIPEYKIFLSALTSNFPEKTKQEQRDNRIVLIDFIFSQ